MNITKEQRQQRGLCTDCGAVNDSGRVKCDDCRRHQAQQVSERKARLRAAGLCQRCECETDTRLCDECYRLERDYQIKWRQQRRATA